MDLRYLYGIAFSAILLAILSLGLVIVLTDPPPPVHQIVIKNQSGKTLEYNTKIYIEHIERKETTTVCPCDMICDSALLDLAPYESISMEWDTARACELRTGKYRPFVYTTGNNRLYGESFDHAYEYKDGI